MAQRSRGSMWSPVEVEATVAAYFEMLEALLKGTKVVKAEQKRALARQLNDRSPDAAEYKFRNISAILAEEHVPYISGFTPLYNYQELLREVVLKHLWARRSTQDMLQREVMSEPAIPSVDDILSRLIEAPVRKDQRRQSTQDIGITRAPTDYLLIESRNRALGHAGEEFVVRFEQARLIAERREALAAKVEQVSVSRGDSLGYDILSFSSDDRERLIEVKTTKSGEYMPFYVSRNELAVSKRDATIYHLYRVFKFGASPGLFIVTGSLDETCKLAPVSFIAQTN